MPNGFITPLYLAVALTFTSTMQVYAMESLSRFTWEKRILILFGDNESELLRQQVDLLTSQVSDLADRDMVVLQV